jgi:OOP family OmpA-OmpF porin
MLQTLRGLIGLPVLAGIVYFGAQSLAVQVEAGLRASAERMVSQLGEGILDPKLRVAGRDLVIEGVAVSEADRDQAVALLSYLPEIRRLAVELKVAPAAMSPFVFSAKSGAGALRLEGSAPFQDLEGIRASAPSLFPGGAISDALAPASGAPRSFSAAIAAGLQALAELRQGQLIISDRLVTLTGEAKPASNLAESLALRLPQGYGLILQLTTPAAATP